MNNLNPSDTPLLLILFNRPNEVSTLIKSIKNIKSKKIYISIDGPRYNNLDDISKISEVKEIISRDIDWDCEIFTKFSDINLGCKYNVTYSIDWFFNNEEMGIILEDDTIPSDSFFFFCTELLHKFKHNHNIYKISGFNIFNKDYLYQFDYFFTNYSFTWGWASWRRAWVHNDVDMKIWNDVKNLQFHNHYPFDNSRNSCFNEIDIGLDTWDYQWDLTMITRGGLQIVPRISLIKNIGFNDLATHTKNDFFGIRSSVLNNDINFPLKHFPEIFLPNRDYELKLFRLLRKEKSFIRIFMYKIIKYVRNIW